MMATRSQRREARGPIDAGRVLDSGQARDGQGGCVLIVDDDVAGRLVCAVNLEAEGLHVPEAKDGVTKPFDPRARASFVGHELVAARAGSSDLTATVAN